MFRCLLAVSSRCARPRPAPCRPLIEALEYRLVPSATASGRSAAPVTPSATIVQSTPAIVQAVRGLGTAAPAIVFAPDSPPLNLAPPPTRVAVPPASPPMPLPIVALPVELPAENTPIEPQITVGVPMEQANAAPSSTASEDRADSVAAEAGATADSADVAVTSPSCVSLPPDTSA